ncbi:hypothetical protein Nepgr_018242 [Nepenthes gracilis]|uniref:Uncharacterized protein n=1 Tax=Nepenthes gracilis TaxID=150966 RepID=A0AAD3SUE3_NEPGR|nr:hypothetical protein Nepgr_018242 [Nepenthes gracilis]
MSVRPSGPKETALLHDRGGNEDRLQLSTPHSVLALALSSNDPFPNDGSVVVSDSVDVVDSLDARSKVAVSLLADISMGLQVKSVVLVPPGDKSAGHQVLRMAFGSKLIKGSITHLSQIPSGANPSGLMDKKNPSWSSIVQKEGQVIGYGTQPTAIPIFLIQDKQDPPSQQEAVVPKEQYDADDITRQQITTAQIITRKEDYDASVDAVAGH